MALEWMRFMIDNRSVFVELPQSRMRINVSFRRSMIDTEIQGHFMINTLDCRLIMYFNHSINHSIAPKPTLLHAIWPISNSSGVEPRS